MSCGLSFIESCLLPPFSQPFVVLWDVIGFFWIAFNKPLLLGSPIIVKSVCCDCPLRINSGYCCSSGALFSTISLLGFSGFPLAPGLKSFHLLVMLGVCKKHGVIALLSYTDSVFPPSSSPPFLTPTPFACAAMSSSNTKICLTSPPSPSTVIN